MKKSILVLTLCSSLAIGSYANAAIPKAGYSNVSKSLKKAVQFQNVKNGVKYTVKKGSSNVKVQLSYGDWEAVYNCKKSTGVIGSRNGKTTKVSNVKKISLIDSKKRKVVYRYMDVFSEIPFQFQLNESKVKVRGKFPKGNYTVSVACPNGVADFSVRGTARSISKVLNLTNGFVEEGKTVVSISDGSAKWVYNYDGSVTAGSNLSSSNIKVDKE